MYLHLGADVLIRSDSIVAICDMDRATVSRSTREFLNRAEKEGRLFCIGDDLPKSFVVCAGGDGLVYTSQLSPETLLKRSVRELDG